MKPVRYEMLGAPTLLYRHHDDDFVNNSSRVPTAAAAAAQKLPIHHHPPTTSPHQRRFHPETLTPQQIRMKEYLERDPFSKWFSRHDDDDDIDSGDGKKKATKRGKRVRDETAADITSDAAAGSIKRTPKRLKLEENWLVADDSDENAKSSDENVKKEGGVTVDLESNEQKRKALQYYTFDIDKSDVPDEYMIATKSAKANNSPHKRQLKEEFSDVNNGDDNIIAKSREVVTETTTRKNQVGGPLGYGNCLVAIMCTCQYCSSSASSTDEESTANNDSVDTIENDDATAPAANPSIFLVHPVGVKLSSVTIDKLCMPRDDGDDTPPQNKSSNNTTIDVGDTILQIEICGKGVTTKVKRMNQEDDCQSECLVVRTARYCVVIFAKACSLKNNCEGESSSSNKDDDDKSDEGSSSSLKRGRRCSATFELIELSRIDLCALAQPSYLPVSVACDPKVVFSPFANPSFAILTRSNEDQTISGINCTTIHEIVQVGDESMLTKHTISSLANISLIEYHASEMSALWAAARATNVPKPYNKDKDDSGGALRGGYGHSLFKINLRNDSASHVWSPSKAEYTSEGVHSINGIMHDSRNKHIVWVSSSSACKVWALDIRHNAANVVMCFSLAQLSDDFGPELGVAGIYGAGMIMTQPLSINQCDEHCSEDASDQEQLLQNNTPPTMFGMKKDPNAYSLHAYQLPTTMPRFQSMPLEASSFVETPAVKYSTSCIARSNIYPLTVCSDKTFRVGLATLRCSSNSALRKADWKDKMGYDTAPDMIYALTMTSVGDIYCHTLLECDSKREVQARQREGMPVGAAAISVPVLGERDDNDNAKAADGVLRILLSNDFLLPFNDVALF